MTGTPAASPPADLSDWIRENIRGSRPPFRQHRLVGGNSNVTLLLTSTDGRQIVVRRPPEGGALATAHNVVREARIMSALYPHGVPVPEIFATCEDPQVLGVPFVAMEYVEGVSCHTSAEAGATTAELRSSVGPSLARSIAGLHRLNVDRIGLGQLGPREDYLARQLHRWRRQVDADRQRPTPDIDETWALLLDQLPAQRRVAVVHGDVRLDNCIVSPQGEILAIVDWELSALGDPLADLGLLLAYWAQPEDQIRVLHDPPTVSPGFSSRAEVAAAYLAAADMPPETDVSYYVAYAWWKIACIVEGVWARAGRKGDALPRPLDSYADQAVRLARHARELSRHL